MTTRLNIAMDVTALSAGLASGTALFVYRLLEALLDHPEAPTLTLLNTLGPGTKADALLAPLAHRAPDRVRNRFDSAAAKRVLGVRRGSPWYPIHPPIRALTGPVDLFHGSDFLWPRADGTPHVISVLDLTTRLFPEHHLWVNRFLHWRKLRWGVRSACRFQVISAATARDLHTHLGVPMDAIDVIPLARAHQEPPPSPELLHQVRQRYALGADDLILCTGTIEPRKNGVRLIEAFDRIADDYPRARLVFAGGPGWRMGSFERALATSRHRDRIHRLGFVAAQDLVALYATATIFAYPSLYEGFGLPILEAMAVGTPVLTSNVSSMPEVAGDAALLCDPTSVPSIAEGLRRLLGDQSLRAELSARGRRRDAGFTWQRTADLTMHSYHRALGTRRAP